MIVYWSTDYQSDLTLTAIPEESLQPESAGSLSSASCDRLLKGLLKLVSGTPWRRIFTEFHCRPRVPDTVFNAMLKAVFVRQELKSQDGKCQLRLSLFDRVPLRAGVFHLFLSSSRT
jgi:hypothetical protein